MNSYQHTTNGSRTTSIRFDPITNKRVSAIINTSTMGQTEVIKLLLNFAVSEYENGNHQAAELKRIRLSQQEWVKFGPKRSPTHPALVTLANNLERLERLIG